LHRVLWPREGVCWYQGPHPDQARTSLAWSWVVGLACHRRASKAGIDTQGDDLAERGSSHGI